MHHLALMWPPIADRQIPVSRDQAMLLLAAINMLFLGLDTYLVHVLNGTIIFREWIPIVFGPVAGLVLLSLGLMAFRRRELASLVATTVFGMAVAVGVLGAIFHSVRGLLPMAPAGERVTLELLIWAPPIFAPLAFALVAVWGISAAWPEDPVDSGILSLPLGIKLQLPYPKSNAYFYIVSMGSLIALVSATLDHARHPWSTQWLWAPVLIGVFAVVVSAGMGMIMKPTRNDVTAYVLSMILLILVGILGAYFHIRADLTSENVIVAERFLRGAPFLSPLLFSNMGFLGLLALIQKR